MNTNMKKVWRCELSALNRTERKIRNDYRKHHRATAKQIATLQGNRERQVKALERSAKRGFDATNKEIARIQVRRAVLQGRLS